MAKDTEKLIRQLSLISYLMAERRPVTALEIRRDVEGYSGMNEDAFARRFYAAVGRSPMHTRRKGLDREQNKELLVNHLRLAVSGGGACYVCSMSFNIIFTHNTSFSAIELVINLRFGIFHAIGKAYG